MHPRADLPSVVRRAHRTRLLIGWGQVLSAGIAVIGLWVLALIAWA